MTTESPLTRRHREAALWQAVSRGEGHAREELMALHDRLAVSVVSRYRWFWSVPGRHLQREDLVQEARIGLARAIDKYDPERGMAFSTMAVPWINQAVQRAIQQYEDTIRIPEHVHDEIRRAHRGEVEFPEVGAVTASLDAPLNHDEDSAALVDLLADVLADTEVVESPESIEDAAKVRFALSRIPRVQQEAIRTVFGFDGHPMSYREAAKILGVNRGTLWFRAIQGIAAIKKQLAETQIDGETHLELLHVPVRGSGPRNIRKRGTK